MSAAPISGKLPGGLVRLKERNGAPRHEDEKLATLVKGAVSSIIEPLERQHREDILELRKIAMRMESGFLKLSETIEAFAIGSEDVAIAGLIDGESNELPNLNRFKAEATVLYKMTAKDIGTALDMSPGTVGYLLSGNGLDWITRKPLLWNHEFYKLTKRRLWHVDVVKLLTQVATNLDHEEREGISERCCERLNELASANKALKRQNRKES